MNINLQTISNWWTMVLLSILRHIATPVIRSVWTMTHLPQGLVHGVSEVFTSGGTTAVKIYFEETDRDRWYLRVNQ